MLLFVCCCFFLIAVAGSPVVTEEVLDGMLHLPEVVHRQIQLTTDPGENQLLRCEFYYEQVCIYTGQVTTEMIQGDLCLSMPW